MSSNDFGCDAILPDGTECPKDATKRFWTSSTNNGIDYQDACNDHHHIFNPPGMARRVQDLSPPTEDIRPPKVQD